MSLNSKNANTSQKYFYISFSPIVVKWVLTLIVHDVLLIFHITRCRSFINAGLYIVIALQGVTVQSKIHPNILGPNHIVVLLLCFLQEKP